MIRKQFSFWEGKLDFVIERPKSTFSFCASQSQVMHIQQIIQNVKLNIFYLFKSRIDDVNI